MRTLLAIPLAALLFGCTLEVVADSVDGSFTKNLTVEGPVALEVQSSSGSVEVRGVDGDEVRVYGKIRAGWRMSHEEAEKRVRDLERNPPVEIRNGVVMVGKGVSPAMLENVSVSYEITIPKRAKATVRTSSGSQTIENLAGPLDVDSSSGSVHIRGVEHDVEVEVSSGSLDVEDVGGSVTADSSSGSQRFRRIAGGVKTRSSSGGVTIEEVGGQVDVRASSGSVRVQQASPAPVTVNASSGGIRLETARESGYEFDIRTGSGGIDLPDEGLTLTESEKRHKKGTLRGGGPMIALQAHSGSVDLR
jgi:DUF4097 and DUF4098 domain-containing protein YvlB